MIVARDLTTRLPRSQASIDLRAFEVLTRVAVD